jgi:hypothetical protein
MPYGQHKGALIHAVPAAYRQYIVANGCGNPGILARLGTLSKIEGAIAGSASRMFFGIFVQQEALRLAQMAPEQSKKELAGWGGASAKRLAEFEEAYRAKPKPPFLGPIDAKCLLAEQMGTREQLHAGRLAAQINELSNEEPRPNSSPRWHIFDMRMVQDPEGVNAGFADEVDPLGD